MPVSSMTGFAHVQMDSLLGTLAIEVKSVNSRYQEISMRLPEELRFLEGDIRSVLAKTSLAEKLNAGCNGWGKPFASRP